MIYIFSKLNAVRALAHALGAITVPQQHDLLIRKRTVFLEWQSSEVNPKIPGAEELEAKNIRLLVMEALDIGQILLNATANCFFFLIAQ